ncbi:MAG: SGNH/GDSL hydrolase family protein [Lentisphaeria bacterium]|nr:SGNH/GDSL hydrolase family protein [Lentisphaeria bacterium]
MKIIDLTEKFYRGCAGGCVRMNDALLACFDTAPKYLLRAKCPSGVRICFSTDAREMTFSLVFGQAVRPVFTSDCFIDARRITLQGEGPHKLEFPPGEKNVSIHLPHLVRIDGVEIAVNDEASVVPVPEMRPRILFCGDSIMQGMVTTSPFSAPAPRTAAALNMDFINTSVGGAKMDPEHVRLTALLPGDFMIVALGVNDAIMKTPPDAFAANTEKSLACFETFRGKKYLVLPIPNTAPSTPDLNEYREIIRACAGKYPGIRLLDGYEFFPAQKENYHDGTHPNDRGAALYAEYLTQTIGDGR